MSKKLGSPEDAKARKLERMRARYLILKESPEWRRKRAAQRAKGQKVYRQKHHKKVTTNHNEWARNARANETQEAKVKRRAEKAAYMRGWISRNREKTRSWGRRYNRAVRDQVFARYGTVCACCGETTYEFLTLDHINNDGAEHRRKEGIGKGAGVYKWVIANGFPKDFQTLCYNCNCAKGFHGQCPHQAFTLRSVANL